MAPRPKLAREQLQAVALALADEQGLAALSMRNLAAALGTSAMTLYNYVRDRDELDALVVEAVMAEAGLPQAVSSDWREEVRAIAQAIWLAIRAHPNVVPLVLTRRSMHEATLEPAEHLLRALAGSGRSGSALLIAYRTVFSFIVGLAQAQLTGPFASGASKDETVARVKALPITRFPKLVEIAEAAQRTDPQDEFDAGLELILNGLAARSL